MAGKVVVRTFETYANSPEEATEFIKRWEQGESEEPEGGVRATSYKLHWDEFDLDDPTEERNKVLAAFLNLMHRIPGLEEKKIIIPPKLGATGEFPQGKISPADEGELKLAITHDQGNVIINFGKAIVWFGMPPKEARQFGMLVIGHASEIEKGK